MIKTGIVGAGGKMGKTLITLIGSQGSHASDPPPAFKLTAAVEQPGTRMIGVDAGEMAGIGQLGVTVTDDLAATLGEVDVLIDFTIAAATARHLEVCQDSGTPMVIGTTGLDDAALARLHQAGQSLPIVFASNYSVGVNTTFKLVELAARAFGDSVDIEIVEAHHRHKVDAPSGTALALGELIAKARGWQPGAVNVFGRHGQTGPRPKDAIGFHSIRAGHIVGDHSVIFTGTGERLEITHRADSRENFAQGALQAVTWLVSQPPGVYDMQDILGLNPDR